MLLCCLLIVVEIAYGIFRLPKAVQQCLQVFFGGLFALTVLLTLLIGFCHELGKVILDSH